MHATPPLDNKRKELLYKSTHRGTKENDLLLGAFAERALPGMDAIELAQYEEFLNIADQMLFAWITGQSEAEVPYKKLVLSIQSMHK